MIRIIPIVKKRKKKESGTLIKVIKNILLEDNDSHCSNIRSNSNVLRSNCFFFSLFSRRFRELFIILHLFSN